MGSKGVISCFLDHLAFDEKQSTVSNMQTKIVMALTFCCRDGFNRAKFRELGGFTIFMGILGSELYHSVHLPVLSCLPEFLHDKSTLSSLIDLGAVPAIVEFLNTAFTVLKPRETGPSVVVPETSVATVVEPAAKRLSLKSPSYQSEVEGNRLGNALQSPGFSPFVADEVYFQEARLNSVPRQHRHQNM